MVDRMMRSCPRHHERVARICDGGVDHARTASWAPAARSSRKSHPLAARRGALWGCWSSGLAATSMPHCVISYGVIGPWARGREKATSLAPVLADARLGRVAAALEQPLVSHAIEPRTQVPEPPKSSWYVA